MNTFLGSKILLITAHPDDESYVAAGTIAENYRRGGTTALLCASFGEQGSSHLKKKLTRAMLAKVRQKELKEVCHVLHIATHAVVGLPDGRIESQIDRLVVRGKKFVRHIHPRIIISFGRDGISGHRDHIAVGQAAKQIASYFQLPFFTFTLPPKIVQQAIGWLKTRRHSPHYVRSIRYAKPDIRVSINGTIKRRALRCHTSQMDNQKAFTGFPPFAVAELLKAEYFVKQ